MLSDKELDALLMLLRNGGTQLSRLNLAECRQVFRFAESQGFRITAPAKVAGDPGLAAALDRGSAARQTDGQ